MGKPNDRLPYADCAYIEATLSTGDGGLPASDAAGHADEANESTARCPLCHRARRATLGAEALDVLRLRFWSADHRRFDHIGFARAVMAACTD
ncbi:MAG TPA: hypothetical protein VGH48_12775 [Caldimonas sp.]